MEQSNSGIIDVLSGKESVKLEISLSPSSLLYIGLAVFVSVALGLIVANKIS